MWNAAIRNLESDPIFKDANIRKLKVFNSDVFEEKALKLFEKLSTAENTDFEAVTDLIHELCGEIKYSYFLYGILAGNVIEEFSG